MAWYNPTMTEFQETKTTEYIKCKVCSTRREYFQTGIVIPGTIRTDDGIVTLDWKGWLIIEPGFAWDLGSGPTWDTRATVRATKVHDALYLLMQLGLLSHEEWRDEADECLRRLMLEDGASEFRADYWHWGVENFGESHAVKQPRPLLYAP